MLFSIINNIMFWLFSNSNSYEFYQIFSNSNLIDIEDNHIYKLTNLIDFDITKYKSINITYLIKIIDQKITYLNVLNNNIITFSFVMNFIDEKSIGYNEKSIGYNEKSIGSNEKLLETTTDITSKLIIHCEYKVINENKMPNLTQNLYDNYYKLNFEIFTINNDLLFIKETNLSTNIIKNYWISKNPNI